MLQYWAEVFSFMQKLNYASSGFIRDSNLSYSKPI